MSFAMSKKIYNYLFQPAPENDTMVVVEERDCSERDSLFNLFFTLGCAVDGSTSFPFGAFFDRFGLRTSRIIMRCVQKCLKDSGNLDSVFPRHFGHVSSRRGVGVEYIHVPSVISPEVAPTYKTIHGKCQLLFHSQGLHSSLEIIFVQ